MGGPEPRGRPRRGRLRAGAGSSPALPGPPPFPSPGGLQPHPRGQVDGQQPAALPREHPRQGGDQQAVRRDPLDHRAVSEGRGRESRSCGGGRGGERRGGSADLARAWDLGVLVLLLKVSVFTVPPFTHLQRPRGSGRGGARLRLLLCSLGQNLCRRAGGAVSSALLLL